MAGFSDALQNVLTRGIDAAKQIKLSELQVNNPNLNVVGPYGYGAESGQGAYNGSAIMGSIPPVVWYAGAGLLIALVTVRLLGK